ncbi:MAG: DUF2339 domain-containing protein, partial [Gammaproteobacteria bacterium]|nr:DUF2339 domain-containing protein [Gammaproteobacteria bacterium]
LAVLQDARALAVIGALGGFATPLLVSTGSGNHVALFSYYFVLDLGIALVAWHRTWRSLNLIGFLGTFVVGSAWGVLKYVPENYATSQGFLIAFFLLFTAIMLMPLRRDAATREAPLPSDAWVQGALLFGLPTITFVLQHGLVRHTEYGSAISALVLALFYIGLATWLRARPHRAVHLCRAGAPEEGRDHARGAPGLLRHRHSARKCPAARAEAGRPAAVRCRCHGQHRFRTQARGRHAPSAAAQRPVRLQPARPSPCSGSDAVCAGRFGRGGGFRLRAAFRSVRARHPCHGAGDSREECRHAAGDRGARGFLSRPAVRAGLGGSAPHQERGGQQLCAPGCRGEWAHGRSNVRGRQPQQGRGRWRGAMDEPPARLRRNRRAAGAGSGMDLR